ncbi:methyltransferase domain-containing protein [Achromobacter dolens]|uniref:O-linked N-acetylglucosamine transferase family protein n=2 Tax=Burkholderiales TaxID=80840 RepID=UPI0022B91273|nr:methyltransferase domain-containing protein [Achromobacter dolens]MCZ8410520.1 methyltransferase domain-containing protein [Achromobacter dolens]
MSYPAHTQRQAAADPGRLAPSHSPVRLRATAHLYGVDTVPLDNARVLAIGCGDGAGLLPFALAHPQAQAVGIDGSETLVAQGTAAARQLGAANLTLYVGEAADIGTQLGLFDYVIVTGLYSYLPAPAQQALLQACGQLLSPRGILYLDSHVYPGAKSLEVVRDAILLHGHAAQNDAELRQSATAALSLFKDGLAASNPHASTLAAAAEQFARALGDTTAGANPLSCNPSYFVELAGVAAQAGLAYLGDAQPLSELPLSFGQGVSLNHSLLAMGQPVTVRQQYLDFATGRAFRQCLWLRNERSAEVQRPDLARLRDLRFASGPIRLAANGQEQGATYVNHLGRALVTHDADVVTVVDTLAHAWPGSLPYSTLQAVLLYRNQIDNDAGTKILQRVLQTLLEHDLVHYCLDRGPYDTEGGDTFHLLPFMTETVADGEPALPRFNLWHEAVNYLPPPEQAAVVANLAAGRLPSAAADLTPAPQPADVAETLALLKRYALTQGSPKAWADLLRRTLEAAGEAYMPLAGMYASARACMSLNSRVLHASGHQPNPPAGIAAPVKRMHELMVQKAYLEAEPVARQLTKLSPRFWDAWEALTVALFSTFRSPQALLPALTMLNLAPADPQSHIVLAAVLTQLGRTSEAIGVARRAIELEPRSAETHSALADALAAERRYKEAEACNQTALDLDPTHRKALINLSKIYIDSGEVTKAELMTRRTLTHYPTAPVARNNLLFAMNYSDDRTAEEVFQAYRDYDTDLCMPLRSSWKPHANTRDPARKLKVGYVSPDFRQHSGNYFIEPVFAHHDRERFELTAYAELATEDATTPRLKAYFDHWVPTAALTDAQLAERIRADGIDILIDVAGHTAGNRLGAFARKPAPVSLTWLGFGYTTGLSAIDYIMTDGVMLPEGYEHLFSEKPWRLPQGNFIYRPGGGMGDPGPLPALKNGYVTLGTLTRAIRMNDRTVKVWSEILRRLPQAHLVVNSTSYRDGPMCEQLIRRFEAHGIERQRLEIGCTSPAWDVLRAMDIGLDCFPHNSGVTLVETLYMGVPYVTLADRPSVGRIGASVLHSIGHPEWVAESEEAYIRKVVALASDLPALEATRNTLRAEMHASPLMDEPAFARKFEAALRGMFTNWCENQA